MKLYDFSTEHISGYPNKVYDTLSRLCKSVAGNSRYYPNRQPRLMDFMKRLAKHVKQLELFDTFCQEWLRSHHLTVNIWKGWWR